MGKNRVKRVPLEEKIERVREKMFFSGIHNGLNHKKTIRLSQYLDKLLNKQMGGGK